ncbi:MAG: PTS sugar transporter subunit IIA [Planctomycetota bacterium]
MRITDILQADCVIAPLQVDDKQQAIDSLANVLVQNTGVQDGEALRQAIWAREKTRTTGIGHGIAIPHGKADGIDRLRMAVGLEPKGIEFGAIDGKPVDLIMLLASPSDQTGPHIQALARISRMLTDEAFRNRLKQAPTGQALYDLIAEHEAAIAG